MKRHIICATALIGILNQSAWAGQCGGKTMPAGAKPYTKAELIAAFSGKTWKWDDGGSYWAPDGTFVGISASHKGIGKGTWTADDSGKLCYDAIWNTPKSKGPYASCWAFAKNDKASFDADMQGNDKGIWHCSDAKTGGKLGMLKDGDSITPQIDGLTKKWGLK